MQEETDAELSAWGIVGFVLTMIIVFPPLLLWALAEPLK